MITTADLKGIFDAFPDYDVFNDKINDLNPKQPRKRHKEIDYIQYNEADDFRNQQPTEEPIKEHSTEYRDDYGVYKVYEERPQNATTILFFPIALLWLEITLRLGCNEPLFNTSIIYITLSFSSVFTLLSTFGNPKFNRKVCNLLLAVLTLLYIVQIVYYNITGSFLTLTPTITAPNITIDIIFSVAIKNVTYILFMIAPLFFNIVLGRFIFPFRRVRVPAKIFLIIVAVLFQFIAIGGIDFDNYSDSNSSQIYHSEFNANQLQERFGLLTMECLDITQLVSEENKN